MKTTTCIVVLALVSRALVGSAEEVPAVVVPDRVADRLLRTNLSLTSRYRAAAQKLTTTPFNCGRVIYFHPFFGEESVSVYSARSPDATIRYKITYIQSDRNLYHLSAEGRAPSAVNGARIKRVDAELPEKTAKLVKQVWLRLLRDARGTYPPARDQWEAVPTDSTQVEFSVQGETANAEFGLLNLFLATQRSKVEKLLHIGNDLVSYCKVSPGKRLRIAANINKEANELLAELH